MVPRMRPLHANHRLSLERMDTPLIDTYLAGLRAALPAYAKAALATATGASRAQLDDVRRLYPQCPSTLLGLLARINGTYWQEYAGEKIQVLMLGSDVFEYPYYLLSAEQIIEEGTRHRRSIAEIYAGYLDEYPDLVDPRIDMALPMNQRLCFSHCMNNGGTSQLFIDFNPTATGRVGQVVRFLHDPDSYVVIADDFDQYLQGLIDGNYAFIVDYGDEDE